MFSFKEFLEAQVGPYNRDDDVQQAEMEEDAQAAFDQIAGYASRQTWSSGKKNVLNANYGYWSRSENAQKMIRKAIEGTKDKILSKIQFAHDAGKNIGRGIGRTILRDFISGEWVKKVPGEPFTMSRKRAEALMRLGLDPAVHGHPFYPQATGLEEPFVPEDLPRGTPAGKYKWGGGERVGPRKIRAVDPRYA